MKRIGSLLFLVCMSLWSAAQNTVDIYAAAPLGTYRTGNSNSTIREDNLIRCTNLGSGQRGYAVFSLTSIPATAVITSVELHFNNQLVLPGGGSGWYTYGYVGDLSTITTPISLLTAMSLPSNPELYPGTDYTSTLGNKILPTDPAAETFVSSNIGTVVSVIWSTGTTTQYTITGETGSATPTGAHAPFLRITYTCPGITSITATPPAAIPCPNSPFTLTGAVVGTASSYLWSGPAGFSSTMLSPGVPAGLPSTGTFTFVATDATGCSARATAIVTVNTAPSTLISVTTPAAFCPGGTSQLDAVSVVGNNYQWFDGGVAIAGATNSTYMADTTGNFTVKVTDGNGCTATTAVPQPTILLDNPGFLQGDTLSICYGDDGTITANTNGVVSSVTYKWQKNGTTIPTATGISYVVSSTGTYRAIIDVPTTGCTDTTTDIYVVVNPNTMPTITSSGGTLAIPNTYASYQWYLNTVSIAGATSNTFTPTLTGSYRVRVVDMAGCTSFSVPFSVFTTGVADVNTYNVSVYPNPAGEVLKINAPFATTAVLTGIDGREVASTKSGVMDLKGVPAGLYLVSVFSDNGEKVYVEKIIRK